MPSMVLWIFVLCFSSKLASANAVSAVKTETIRVGGLQRLFYVQYPPAHSKPSSGWPVVFSLHGYRGNAAKFASWDGLRYIAGEQAIVVHPEGYEGSWNGGGTSGAKPGEGEDGPTCNLQRVRGNTCTPSCRRKGFCKWDDCRYSHCEDDVAFILAILGHLKTRIAVDTSKIFATGSSNGGQMLFELASDPRSARVFAALAPIVGLPHNGFNYGNPSGQTRLLAILGNRDDYVYPHANDVNHPTRSFSKSHGWYYSNLKNTTALWAKQRGLPPTSKKRLSGMDRRFDCYGWSNDTSVARAVVASCLFEGGHDGAPAGAFELVWDFFTSTNNRQGRSPKCTRTQKCGNMNCDEWIQRDSWYTCNVLEKRWSCDCSGCSLCERGFSRANEL